MNYKKIIPYKLRRALSMATIAGATLMPASCSKVEKEEPRDVVIEFDETNLNEQLNKEKLQELANDKSVKKGLLQPTMEISPKMRGQGDFDFKLGAASKVPTDSLWFVKNGWTINIQSQR